MIMAVVDKLATRLFFNQPPIAIRLLIAICSPIIGV